MREMKRLSWRQRIVIFILMLAFDFVIVATGVQTAPAGITKATLLLFDIVVTMQIWAILILIAHLIAKDHTT